MIHHKTPTHVIFKGFKRQLANYLENNCFPTNDPAAAVGGVATSTPSCFILMFAFPP